MRPSTVTVLREVALACAASLILISSGFWGWLVLWFQLEGSADRTDHLIAATAFATGAGLLLLTAATVALWRAPGWQLVATLAGATLLAFLALGTGTSAPPADPTALPYRPLEAISNLAWWPWTWPVYVLLPLGIAKRLRTPRGHAAA
jgi:hypothetical protein